MKSAILSLVRGCQFSSMSAMSSPLRLISSVAVLLSHSDIRQLLRSLIVLDFSLQISSIPRSGRSMTLVSAIRPKPRSTGRGASETLPQFETVAQSEQFAACEKYSYICNPPPVKTKIGEYKESNNSGCQILLDIFIRNGYGHTSLVAFDYVRIRAQSLRTIRTFPTHLIRMRSDSELFRSFFLRVERQDKHLFHRFLSKSFLEI